MEIRERKCISHDDPAMVCSERVPLRKLEGKVRRPTAKVFDVR